MPHPPIDSDYLKDTLAQLLRIPSPSGMTDAVVVQACAMLDQLGIAYTRTRRGAIRACLPGQSSTPQRAVAAHLDTLGAIVKRLKPNGRLGLVPVGTWSPRFAEGARVTIHCETGAMVRGTVLPLKASGHTYHKEVDAQPAAWDNLEIRIDEPCLDINALWALGLRVGDFISLDPNLEFSTSGYVNSRYLDDKAGVSCLLAALKALVDADATPATTTHIFLTVTEEIGSGAAHIVPPDVAELVSIDNGAMAPEQNTCEFGVTIAMQDSSGPFDRALTNHLIALCRNEGLEFSRDIFNHYRSDGAGAQEAGHDLRVGLICFGLDASHGYERVHMRSLEAVAGLMAAYLLSPALDPEQPATTAPSSVDSEQQKR